VTELLQEVPGGSLRALRGVIGAIATHKEMFALSAMAVFALHIAVPPIVLSIARKPADFFTFNPWLIRLPEYLQSGPGSVEERLERIWSLAIFWFSASNPYGVEWGFAVTVADLARFLLMSLLIAAYFTVWAHRNAQLAAAPWGIRAGRRAGVLGALSGGFGLATGGCTVMGCGAPVIPVIGLAFAGLSSGTLKLMSELSSLGTALVVAGLALGVLYLGWRVGGGPPRAVSTTSP